MEKSIKELANIIKNSRNTVVMTGAGMDTESNIPDFRSKDGIWQKIDPRKVATIDAIYANYPLFRDFYIGRIKNLDNVKPHEGHYVLADLEDRGYIKSIATQNISGLHAMAGSKNIYELHGNIKDIICNNCKQTRPMDEFLEGKSCGNCGKEELRPGVVLFGEVLPAMTFQRAISDIESSDLLIVIGTSLEVSPVNQFPYMTRGKTVYINMEDVRGYNFDLKIIGKAKEVLAGLRGQLL